MWFFLLKSLFFFAFWLLCGVERIAPVGLNCSTWNNLGNCGTDSPRWIFARVGLLSLLWLERIAPVGWIALVGWILERIAHVGTDRNDWNGLAIWAALCANLRPLGLLSLLFPFL